MSVKNGILIFDLRPNIYKIGLYKAISKKLFCSVIFLNNLGVEKPYYDSRYHVERKSDVWLLENLDFKFLGGRAILRFAELAMLIFHFRRKGGTHVMIQGYNKIDYWAALFLSKILLLKVIYRGEGTLRQHEARSMFYVKSILLRAMYFLSHKIFYTCTGNKKYFQYYLAQSMLNKLTPLSCAVDNDFYRSGRLKSDLEKFKFKQELKIDNNMHIILFVGQLGHRKRPQDVIECVSQSSHKKRITCLFVGTGPLQRLLEDLSVEKGVNCHFVGFIDQRKISSYYSIADAFILPSQYDNSPKVLNEAMNFGLPSIVTDVCGQSTDLITSTSIGHLVSVGDVPAMATALDLIIKNIQSNESSASEIISKVSYYNFERNAEELLNAL